MGVRRRESVRAAPSFTAKSDDDDDENEEFDDLHDFIVHTDAEERGVKRNRHIMHSDPSLQEAQEIFGVDFDFEEFDDQHSEETGESDYEDEEDEDAELRRRQKKEIKTASRDVLYEIFDASDLERKFYCPEDEKIRRTDVPERMQLRKIPIRKLNAKSETYNEDLLELEKEAKWIFSNAFKNRDNKFVSL